MPVPDWLSDGFPEDNIDTATAEQMLGRFACSLCADNRDAAEHAEAQLKKAHALLRLVARTYATPTADLSEDARERVILAHVAALAVLRARVELYFEAIGERLSEGKR